MLLADPDRARIAAPWPVLRVLAEAGLDRIVHDVSVGIQELVVVVDPSRSVTPKLDVASQRVAAVEVARVAEVQGVHRGRKHAVGDVDDQMVMGRHQAEGNTLPLCLRGNAGEFAEVVEPIDVVSEVRRSRPDAVREHVEHPGGRIARLVRHFSATVARTES